MLAAVSRNWPIIVRDVVRGVPLATYTVFTEHRGLICIRLRDEKEKKKKNHLAHDSIAFPFLLFFIFSFFFFLSSNDDFKSRPVTWIDE